MSEAQPLFGQTPQVRRLIVALAVQVGVGPSQIVCQDQNLTKDQYHQLLGQAKIVFSANLQETLGISCYEGALVNAIPIVPDRLSYTEMYSSIFRYPSAYTESWDSYQAHKSELMDVIHYHIENYPSTLRILRAQAHSLHDDFFSATTLLENIK